MSFDGRCMKGYYPDECDNCSCGANPNSKHLWVHTKAFELLKDTKKDHEIPPNLLFYGTKRELEKLCAIIEDWIRFSRE